MHRSPSLACALLYPPRGVPLQRGLSDARTPRRRTPPAPAASAACCARAGRTASGTAWSAPRSGCAGPPASGSSWRRSDGRWGDGSGCTPAGRHTCDPAAPRSERGPERRVDLRRTEACIHTGNNPKIQS